MSRNHTKLDPRRWAAVRRAALKRAGYRSERSGMTGRLEVHHKVRLEDGGDPYDLDNLEVLTRTEHMQEHRRDNMVPGRGEWLDFLEEFL